MRNETPIEELTDLCGKLNKMFWTGQFAEVNQMLLDMPMSDRIEILVGTLRFSWCANQHLPDYAKVVNRVYAEVERRGYDPERLLRGLYEGQSASS
jgi:hypothetical protein